MKIVVNKCFGGFSLSALAVKRMAELSNKPCYLFKTEYKDGKLIHIPTDLKDCENTLFFSAYTVENPDEYISGDDSRDEETYLSPRPDDRTDEILIQVIEELGEKANGACASLSIIEIPDDVDWEINEYDGLETIGEKHRSW